MCVRQYTCQHCECKAYYQGPGRVPPLCIDCARGLRGEYSRPAPHSPACACPVCRPLDLDDDGTAVDLAELARGGKPNG